MYLPFVSLHTQHNILQQETDFKGYTDGLIPEPWLQNFP